VCSATYGREVSNAPSALVALFLAVLALGIAAAPAGQADPRLSPRPAREPTNALFIFTLSLMLSRQALTLVRSERQVVSTATS
jgi:hypothetical protein